METSVFVASCLCRLSPSHCCFCFQSVPVLSNPSRDIKPCCLLSRWQRKQCNVQHSESNWDQTRFPSNRKWHHLQMAIRQKREWSTQERAMRCQTEPPQVDLPTRHRWSTLTSEGSKKGSSGWPAALKSSRTWRSFWCQPETLWPEVLHRSEVSLDHFSSQFWVKVWALELTSEFSLCDNKAASGLLLFWGDSISLFTSSFLRCCCFLTRFTCVYPLCCSVFLPQTFLSNFLFWTLNFWILLLPGLKRLSFFFQLNPLEMFLNIPALE